MTGYDDGCFSVIVLLSSPIKKKKSSRRQFRINWPLFLLVAYLTDAKLTLCVDFFMATVKDDSRLHDLLV